MGSLLLIVSMAAGGFAAYRRRLHENPLISLWLGTALGLAAMCVLPAAYALAARQLTPVCTWISTLLWLAAMGIWAFYPRQGAGKPAPFDRKQLLQLVCFALPLTGLAAVLFVSHVLQPGEWGLYGGQCTFGDLSMHLGMITSMAEQRTFPPNYSILYGERMGYPFLADLLSAAILQLGGALRWAVIVPSVLMAALTFAGFWLFVLDATGRKRTATVAGLLFFLGGGLGFAWFLEGAAADPSVFTRIFTEYYQTPTNYTLSNLRWVNVIADMMIPQRTTLLGWAMVPAALVLLRRALRTCRPIHYALAGVLIGCMPMMHTHSFMAVGCIGIGWALTEWPWKDGIKAWGRKLVEWLWFLLPCALLALPQLIVWTFPQSGGEGFLRIGLDWVNRADPVLWFWVKNLGLPVILLIPALVSGGKKAWAWCSGAIGLWLVAMVIVFQPNEYDNNKLLLVAWMLLLVPVAEYMGLLWDQLRGVRGRAFLAAVAAVVLFASGTLTLAREVLSGGKFLLYTHADVAAAEKVREETAPDALFITGDQHLNLITALSGRNTWVGSPSYLFFHGFDLSARQDQVAAIYTDPEAAATLPQALGAGYILVTNYERGSYPGCESHLQALYPEFFRQGDVVIYQVQ